MAGIDEVIGDLSNYLEWQREEGEVRVELDPAVIAELRELATAGAGGAATARSVRTAATAVHAASLPEAKPTAAPQVEQNPSAISNDTLEKIAEEIQACSNCVLHESRTNTVPGKGQTKQPDIMFVGEAPGADEDAQGIPFVGRSGQLLTDMIAAMGYSRETVFIANINKCRPPGNRKPSADEMSVCLTFLKRQIAIIRPKVIVALGATAVEGLVGMPKGTGITKIRGQWMKFGEIDLMPTFHPAYMLRNSNMKRPVWKDMLAVLAKLGKTPPPKKKKTT